MYTYYINSCRKQDTITCIDAGNIDSIHRSSILKVLQECSENNKMTASDIRDTFHDKGIKTIIFEKIAIGTKLIAWKTPNNHQLIRISHWKSVKYGTYCIIILQFRTINSTEIKCINKGTTSDKDRKVIFKVLKY